MIRDLFFPTSIDRFYLFSQKIAAFTFGKNFIRATLVSAHRRKRVILATHEERIDPEKATTIIDAIAKIKTALGSWNTTVVALPGSRLVYKRLKLPFSQREKIKLVLPFELEASLPFSAEDAVFDFITIAQNAGTGETEVLAAAIQKTVLDAYLKPFFDSGIVPDRITVGALELYGFVKSVHGVPSSEGPVVIVESDEDETAVMLLVDGTLRAVRLLNGGVDHELAKQDASSLSGAYKETFDRLLSETRFTLQASLKNERVTEPVAHLFLVGDLAHMTNAVAVMSERLAIPCFAVHPHTVLKFDSVTVDQVDVLPYSATKGLAAALSSPEVEQFDFVTQQKKDRELQEFTVQSITVLTLLGLLLASFVVYQFMTMRSLRATAERYKQEVLTKVKREFNLQPGPGMSSLELLLTSAEEKLVRQEGIWSALTENRYSFLRYLEELNTRFDRAAWGLDMHKIVIKRDERGGDTTVILDGSVRSFDALRSLETALRNTNLFTYVPPLPDTAFNVPLVVKKTGGVRS